MTNNRILVYQNIDNIFIHNTAFDYVIRILKEQKAFAIIGVTELKNYTNCEAVGEDLAKKYAESVADIFETTIDNFLDNQDILDLFDKKITAKKKARLENEQNRN